MEIIILQGEKFTDREAAHSYLASALRLPDYYGRNLDALADCLSERGPHTHIILTGANALREALGDYGEKLIGVFLDCAAEPYSLHFAVDGE